MSERVDEKGKVFTERVRKASVEVKILTTQGYVHGHVHLMPDQRVRDLLNSREEQFLAVTDAALQAYGADNIEQVGFIALNKQYVISVEPVDLESMRRRQEEEYFIPY
jgi:hypothetical protein